jgi:hypothetical protein
LCGEGPREKQILRYAKKRLTNQPEVLFLDHQDSILCSIPAISMATLSGRYRIDELARSGNLRGHPAHQRRKNFGDERVLARPALRFQSQLGLGDG